MAHSSKTQAHRQSTAKAPPASRFAPVPPIQAKPSAQPAELPDIDLDPSNYQIDLDNPLASMFGHGSLAATLPVQPKLTVGAVGDKYEQEADTVAAQVVKNINSPQPSASLQREGEEEDELQMKPVEVLQRVGQEGGVVPSNVESQIQSAKGSGQSLDSGLQQSMGQAMGADFSSVKVHTDSQSDQLNQSIQAKAFTTGQDVFFRSGEYNPGTQSGQELIAHELTHVVQQGGGTVQKKSVNQTDGSQNAIQRVKFDNTLNKYYSETLEGQKIDATNGVVTATSNSAPGGGHTAIYVEWLKDGTTPENKKIHLTYGAGTSGSTGSSGLDSSGVTDSSSGSSSSSGGQSATDEKGVTINIENGFTARESSKKSWVVNSTQVEQLIAKAEEIQTNQEKYSYTLLGVSPFKKNVMNCARFGEVILKEASIDASAGKVFKLPSTLTKGDDVGYEVDQDYADDLDRRRQEQERQKQDIIRQQQEEERIRQEAEQVAQRYANVPRGKKKATFADGKTVYGSRDKDGQLTTQFTFRADPQVPTDISTTPFAIFVSDNFISLGRLQVEDHNPRGSYYIRIQDILAVNGDFITT